MNRIHNTVLAAMIAALLLPTAIEAQQPRGPEVEDALKRGFAMAQRERWNLAIRYFSNAQEMAPTDPVVLFNLALANDRAPGRNVIAVAWYRAYLAAAPNAKNAEKVRNRVVDLEIESEAVIQDLLATAEAVAAQLTGQPKAVALARIAGAQAFSGDLKRALQTSRQLGSPLQAAWAHARIAAAQAMSGDVTAGVRLAKSIQHRRARNWALAEIAVIQATRKDFASAMSTADAAAEGPDRDFAFSRIAALQAAADNAIGANAAADKISPNAAAPRLVANAAAAIPMSKSELPWIAEKAKQYLGTVLTQAQEISNAQSRQIALLQVVRAQAQTNNFAEANRAALLMIDARFKHLAAEAIAAAKGETQNAEIHRWSAVATYAAASTTMGDVSAMIDEAKSGDPAEAVQLIAGAAEERARFLETLRALGH